MTRVVVAERGELERRHAEILARHGVSLEEFAERAARYALVGDELDDWDELRSIAFLLGE